MRRISLIFLFLLLGLAMAAKPARPGTVRYVQPDGTSINLSLRGDEWGHWALDSRGRVMEQDARGFYRVSAKTQKQLAERSARIREAALGKRPAGIYDNDDRTIGTHKVLVILVEFSDCSFSIQSPQTAFKSLLSQHGYSENGATGSVWDFFNDNSGGLYNPEFDVYGPVNLNKPMSNYGRNNPETNRDQFPGPELALYEACLKLDRNVDFSQYDSDHDGFVDMILFYYAGYDEAEGGSADAIWAHQWDLQSSANRTAANARFDEVGLSNYFCTSELRGGSGNRITGAGATIHEFSHYLGLPDMYDVNDSDDGHSSGMSFFSTMDIGLYNNNADTPPYFTSEELIMLGWMKEADVLPLPPFGEVILPSRRVKAAMRIPTSLEGEHFVLEYLDGQGWDRPLPRGLLITHVDRSDRMVGSTQARWLWEYWRMFNSINSRGDHPCCYFIPSSSPNELDYKGSAAAALFPGTDNVNAFQPLDWDGVPTQARLTGITLEADALVYTVRSAGMDVSGRVSDSSARGVAGATVSLLELSLETQTDDQGLFYLNLDGIEPGAELTLSVFKAGFHTYTAPFSPNAQGNNLNIMLRRIGEPEVEELVKYDEKGKLQAWSRAGRSQMGVVRYHASELVGREGWRLSTVSFYPSCYSASGLYVIVDSGSERVLTAPVQNPVFNAWNMVDVSEWDIRVPEARDMWIGYGVKGADYDYPLTCVLKEGAESTDSYYASFNASYTPWMPMRVTSNYFDLAVKASISEVIVPASLKDMGFVSISEPEGEYGPGSSFPLSLEVPVSDDAPQAVVWEYDGESVSAGSIVLTSGEHLLTAKLLYAGGRVQVLEKLFIF